MKNLSIFFLVLTTSFPFASCRETAIPPVGSYSEVLVVTEDGRNSRFMPPIMAELGGDMDFYTSQEKQFTLSVVKAGNLPDFPTFKTIVILGVADRMNDVGQLIANLLGDSGIKKVSEGSAFIFKRENRPAPGQMTLIITGRSDDELLNIIEERGKELPDIIESSCRKRLRRFFHEYADNKLGRDLFNKYGFVIEVPTLYKLMSDASRPPGIELMRQAPTRSLGIFWSEWKRPLTQADEKKLFDIRANYVYERYDGDAMDSTRVVFSGAKLGPYSCIKMSGYWLNTRSTAGGCYKTFFIFDEKKNLLWTVDLLVYAPGSDKNPLFRELLALAETFRYE